MRIPKILLVTACTLICCSCSWFSSKPKAPATPTSPTGTTEAASELYKLESKKAAAEAFKKDDIILLVKADPQLNRFQNNAHTLLLCIYQLKDPNGFNQLIEEEGGIAKLMECRRFDASVANAKRLIIQPGQELNDVRDRAQGARFIGLVSGYYGMGKEKLSHLVPLTLDSAGDSPGTTITIELGPYEINNVTVK
jgi:predicted component of type VI protein secretion system